MANIIKTITATACGLAGFLWGELDGLLLALLAFMALDYATGVAVGFATKTLSSNTGFIGLARKGLILIIVAVGHILDAQVLGGDASLCRSAVIGFYLANEGLSLLENAGKLGLPLPAFLKQALEQLREKNDKPEKGDGQHEAVQTDSD